MKLDAVPPEILHIDLFEEIDKHKETTTDSEQVEGEEGEDIPQALQIGFPSAFLRHNGVVVVWQFAHEGPPEAAANTAREDCDDLRERIASCAALPMSL